MAHSDDATLLRKRHLAERVRDPGFTPRVRDVDGLVDLLAEDELEKLAERAIARVGAAAFPGLEARFADARHPVRARIVRAVGKLASSPSTVDFLFEVLRDDDPKARRNAAIALGHAAAAGVEEALIRAWTDDPRPEMRRSIAAALGKVGTLAALPLLREAGGAADPELARIAAKSVVIVERTRTRAERGRIDADRAPACPVEVLLVARRGLEDLVAEELAGSREIVAPRAVGPGFVRATLEGPMSALFRSRVALALRFPLATEWVGDGESAAEAVARAATSDAARSVFEAWTIGPPRYRIAWVDGGHRRATTWEAARLIAQRDATMVNDPTASLWELVVQTPRRFVEVAIEPRALQDPRFSWRVDDVPAASHPTIAAALARVAGVRADDVVWDPFVGAGGELVERALLGPYSSLEGTDVDAGALASARRNLDAAGVRATLEKADALVHRPARHPVSLVITNPPMGRRASRVQGLAESLDRFVARAAKLLAPGGRLVWLAPWPERTREAGARAGLRLDWARSVDMGGFDAEMQRWFRS